MKKADSTADVFDRIAPGWYNYRHWSIFREELEETAARWQRGRLLNIGCAHGPDFLPFKDNFELHGLDISPQMLAMAGKYSEKFWFPVNLVLADATHLPYKAEVFDFAISVAALHHIESAESRQSAFCDLARVLRPGGEALITVWNGWQRRFWFKGKETMVPWRIKDETLLRYYYLFSYPEIARLARRAGFRVLREFPEKSWRFPLKYFSRNICLLLKKPG